MIVPARRCKGCHRYKPETEFSRRSDGYRRNYCRDCRENKRKQRKYGLAPEEYQRLLKAQGRKCSICGEEKRLVVDHDHSANKVRGLLCYRCNSTVGFIEGTPYLEKILAYIEANSGV